MNRLLSVAGLVAFTSGVAFAHTELSQSMPADKAALETAPKEVMLHFSEPVRLTMASIEKRGDRKQELGPLPQAPAKDFTLAAPALGEGAYVVTWRAMSEDTHVVNGEITFTVGAAAHGEHSSQPTQIEHSDHSDHSGHR